MIDTICLSIVKQNGERYIFFFPDSRLGLRRLKEILRRFAEDPTLSFTSYDEFLLLARAQSIMDGDNDALDLPDVRS